ncbi:hypothetical protein ABT336_00200 [Micromonospora sp. NPDC000207]|uniref:hypothetical protein n=1 Tax=Micromonospora sp. NPDC000207 TaxID=3154246 RepID=UPI00332506DD
MNSIQALAGQLADLHRRLTAVERGSQMPRTSIEGGTLVVNDETGQPVLMVGLQPAGGYAVAGANGGQVIADAVTPETLDQLREDLELAEEAVTEAMIAVGAITTTKLADDSVTTPKLVAGAVQAGTIAAGAVQTTHLTAQAVSADKLAANAVTTDKLAANAVTAGKLDVDALTAKNYYSGPSSDHRIVMGPNYYNGEWPGIRWDTDADDWTEPQIIGGKSGTDGRFLRVAGPSGPGRVDLLLSEQGGPGYRVQVTVSDNTSGQHQRVDVLAKGIHLHNTHANDATTAAGNVPMLMIGDRTSRHLRIDGRRVIAMAGNNIEGELEVNRLVVAGSPVVTEDAFGSWDSWVPTFSGLGLGAVSTSGRWARIARKTVSFTVNWTVTTTGTGSSNVTWTLPTAPSRARRWTFVGGHEAGIVRPGLYATTFTGGTGAVVDRMRFSGTSNVIGNMMESAQIYQFSGIYEEA